MPQSSSSPTPGVRVHAALAKAGLASRRKVEAWVEEGKVSINGKKATLGQKVVSGDVIKVDGEEVAWEGTPNQKTVCFLVNKPIGVVSTTKDENNRPTVLSLIPKQAERLYPVGRLDIDSEGLVLLTNNGDLAYRFTHPKFGVPKTYLVLLPNRPTNAALHFLESGVKLKEGWVKPDRIELQETTPQGTWLEMVIHDGKYHEVKRMLRRAGYDTLRLIRTELGPFSLAQLGDQKWIKLSDDDVQQLLLPGLGGRGRQEPPTTY